METYRKQDIIIILLVSVALLFLSKIFGFFVDIATLSLAFIFIIKNRDKIVNTMSKNSTTGYKRAVLSGVPFVIFEELVNAPLIILILTIPALLLSISMLLVAVKIFRLKKALPILLLYCIIGIFFETNIGESHAEFAALSTPFYVFMIFWVGLSYAFVALIPLKLYLKKNDKVN